MSNETTTDKQAKALVEITELRKKFIDPCDDELVRLFAERTKHIEKVREIKLGAGLPVHDPKREAAQLEHFESLARLYNTPPQPILAVFRTIFFWSRFFQKHGFWTFEELKRRRPPRTKV